ncbi:hypothetical protein M513_07013 [Trichuris suis]|uniref:Uncharacterized protein n=1 Tax=Trichuris suis TaxID=68888 RepID=A0A085M4M2_9BILA|nr:hypothetical protein M513_07013 [Trichuris suis]
MVTSGLVNVKKPVDPEIKGTGYRISLLGSLTDPVRTTLECPGPSGTGDFQGSAGEVQWSADAKNVGFVVYSVLFVYSSSGIVAAPANQGFKGKSCLVVINAESTITRHLYKTRNFITCKTLLPFRASVELIRIIVSEDLTDMSSFRDTVFFVIRFAFPSAAYVPGEWLDRLKQVEKAIHDVLFLNVASWLGNSNDTQQTGQSRELKFNYENCWIKKMIEHASKHVPPEEAIDKFFLNRTLSSSAQSCEAINKLAATRTEESVQVVKERFFVSFLDYRKDVIHVTFEKFDAASEVVAREGSLFKVFHEEFR